MRLRADSRPCAERRGGEHIIWEGSRRLPGASDCVVFGGTPPAYACTLYAGDAEESADGAYDRAVTGVKDCLPAGWKTTENVDCVHARTTTAAGATGPSIRVVSRDVSGDAYFGRALGGRDAAVKDAGAGRPGAPRGGASAPEGAECRGASGHAADDSMKVVRRPSVAARRASR